ncbi:M3 family metallopeptidase [Notoacmeibacter ruber]|uniref:M3 family peptidase n=1 Tax=Notoacmeibacter ruber TaxID=2670375 RepID=A0A3L7JGJ6_9HYPH|nr:M3 family metallopeptidase [Notoacmeibacter ruber]RLQ89620.1 M3 family peptidase [Notoacmeibacter ruber]
MTAPSIDLAAHPLTHWTGELGLPDFAAIDQADFEPVFDAAMAAHRSEIEAIATNEEAPSVDNTLKAMELAGEPLSRVLAIFSALAGADTNPHIQALERAISPALSRHFSSIAMNEALFARVDALWEKRDELGLDGETGQVLEKTWKGFVRAGAKLQGDDRSLFAEIGARLAELGTAFGQNVLKDEAEWELVLDEADVAGLPSDLLESMAAAAQSRGHEGRYVVTLSRSLYEPFMQACGKAEFRETAYKAFTNRGSLSEETDNAPIIAETLRLRDERAKLLGYETFAAFKLDNTMAKTPVRVMELLEPVWERAKAVAEDDRQALGELASAEGQNAEIDGADWRYWQERLRTERFAFDEAELKPYLALERVIEACFDVARRLFGLQMVERSDLKGWHPDVRAFEVHDADGAIRGLFLADYFNRPSKRSGAWMSRLQSAHKLDGGEKPIIYNVMNFAKPKEGQPALLSMDEARTLFHEFGHALHGLLSEVTWPSISGTSVSRDFVELPSQLYEHWLTVPEIMQSHLRHVRTGEPIPAELMEKLEAAQGFGQGFATVEFTASALMDMKYHDGAPADDPLAFEAQTMDALGKPDAIAMRHRSPHFQHIFAGDGYSAGYYSYMWSEVLDADAFEAFTETGDPFNPEIARKLRENIYAAGGSDDPEKLYTAFRGQMPKPEAMMRKRGLLTENSREV